jgi:uncharacterized protein (UPF0332 family)
LSFPRELYLQAVHLHGLYATQPSQAHLRRAVSACYYSVFHLLIEAASAKWLVVEQRTRFARVFEHGRMKQAALEVSKRLGTSKPEDPVYTADPDEVAKLIGIAVSFVELQSQRHVADYDSSKTWTAAEVEDALFEAESALQVWNEIQHSVPAQEFLLAMFVRDRRPDR